MSILKILEDSINKKADELAELHKAYDIIRAQFTPPEQSAPIPAPLPARAAEQTVAVAPPPKPQYTGPHCGACGSKMYQAGRTMPSGMYVAMWKCNDSACGNEIFT